MEKNNRNKNTTIMQYHGRCKTMKRTSNAAVGHSVTFMRMTHQQVQKQKETTWPKPLKRRFHRLRQQCSNTFYKDGCPGNPRTSETLPLCVPVGSADQDDELPDYNFAASFRNRKPVSTCCSSESDRGEAGLELIPGHRQKANACMTAMRQSVLL